MPRFQVTIIFIRGKKLVKISAQLPVSLSSSTRPQCKTPGPSHIWTHRETPPGLYPGNWPPPSSPVKVSCSVVSDSLRPHGLYSLRNSPGQNTGVGSLSLLHGIFPTQGSNPGLLHCMDSHLGPGLLSLFKSIPGLWGGGRANQIRPTHLHGGRFFNPCHLYTPASAGPAVKEHQLYGKRWITSSDPPQHLSSAGSVQKPLEKPEACVHHSSACAIFLKS